MDEMDEHYDPIVEHPDYIEPSDEVRQEHLERIQNQAKAAANEIIQREAEHLAQNQADHEKRLAAARAFDWDSWEKETGLKRPEIPE